MKHGESLLREQADQVKILNSPSCESLILALASAPQDSHVLVKDFLDSDNIDLDFYGTIHSKCLTVEFAD